MEFKIGDKIKYVKHSEEQDDSDLFIIGKVYTIIKIDSYIGLITLCNYKFVYAYQIEPLTNVAGGIVEVTPSIEPFNDQHLLPIPEFTELKIVIPKGAEYLEVTRGEYKINITRVDDV